MNSTATYYRWMESDISAAVEKSGVFTNVDQIRSLLLFPYFCTIFNCTQNLKKWEKNLLPTSRCNYKSSSMTFGELIYFCKMVRLGSRLGSNMTFFHVQSTCTFFQVQTRLPPAKHSKIFRIQPGLWHFCQVQTWQSDFPGIY